MLGLAGIKNKYKVSELINNGEWLLMELVSLTIGASYPVNKINDFALIDYTALEKEECIAISENFLRDIRHSELIQYKYSKIYTKQSRNKEK